MFPRNAPTSVSTSISTSMTTTSQKMHDSGKLYVLKHTQDCPYFPFLISSFFKNNHNEVGMVYRGSLNKAITIMSGFLFLTSQWLLLGES